MVTAVVAGLALPTRSSSASERARCGGSAIGAAIFTSGPAGGRGHVERVIGQGHGLTVSTVSGGCPDSRTDRLPKNTGAVQVLGIEHVDPRTDDLVPFRWPQCSSVKRSVRTRARPASTPWSWSQVSGGLSAGKSGRLRDRPDTRWHRARHGPGRYSSVTIGAGGRRPLSRRVMTSHGCATTAACGTRRRPGQRRSTGISLCSATATFGGGVVGRCCMVRPGRPVKGD